MTIDKNQTSSQAQPASDPTAQIDAILQQLQGLVGQADSSDLQGLAELHSILGNACSLADSALDKDRSGTFHNTASVGMQLVESIVLKEVDDFRGSIDQLGKTVSDLRRVLAGETIAGTSTTAGAATTSHAPQVAEQTPLSEGDLPLVQEFVGEATGHIEAAETGLLKLEEDVANADAINAVFRSFHTIKGVAGFLNLSQIGALAHAAENVLDLCRKGKMQFNSGIADVILQSVDAMRKLIEILAAIAQTGGTPASLEGLTDLLHRLHDCAEGQAFNRRCPTEGRRSPVHHHRHPEQVGIEIQVRAVRRRFQHQGLH